MLHNLSFSCISVNSNTNGFDSSTSLSFCNSTVTPTSDTYMVDIFIYNGRYMVDTRIIYICNFMVDIWLFMH